MEKLLVEFARHADRERFNLHFICLEGRGTLADEIEALGWKVHVLGKRPGLRPALVFRLARLFRRLRADVVHTHNTAPCIYGAPSAKLAGVPLVVNTRHGQGPAPGTRESRMLALAARMVKLVVCVSNDSANLAVQTGIRVDRICTIWNGIDLAAFPFHGPRPDGPAVVVARLSPEKDIQTLLLAVSLVVRQLSAFKLRVVGDGPCRESLETLAAELRLRANVQFVGETRDVSGHLRQASMFVLPSLTEGLSLTLLEAMATGLPVVATRVGGNAEVVVEGETGLLVDPADPGLMASAILKLATAPTLATQAGAKGRQRVEDAFDVRKMVRAYEGAYLRHLSQPAVAD